MNKNFLLFGLLLLLSVGVVQSYNGDFCTQSHSPCGGGCTSTDLSHMYEGYDFTTDVSHVGDITKWDTSCVTDMSFMFSRGNTPNNVFNQPIGSWNTAKVTNMRGMFFGNTVFNQPIGSWDVSHVTDMSNMFEHTFSFNQPLNSWNTGSVTSMFAMFLNSGFNQPIGSWNTAKVTNMGLMFFGGGVSCSSTKCTPMPDFHTPFNQDISGWDTSHVTYNYRMFGSTTNWYYSNPITNFYTGSVTSDVSTNYRYDGTSMIFGWFLFVLFFVVLALVSFFLSRREKRGRN